MLQFVDIVYVQTWIKYIIKICNILFPFGLIWKSSLVRKRNWRSHASRILGNPELYCNDITELCIHGSGLESVLNHKLIGGGNDTLGGNKGGWSIVFRLKRNLSVVRPLTRGVQRNSPFHATIQSCLGQLPIFANYIMKSCLCLVAMTSIIPEL